MRLKPFFQFFGSKWRLAPHYPEPRHETIVEPFAGSAGYSLLYPHLAVRLNDADPLIAALWKYLVSVDADEIRRLPIGITNVDEAKNVSEEARSLIGFWFAIGETKPRRQASPWMRRPERANVSWGPAIRERIASQVELIRHWEVTNGEYDSLPDREATWFVDPPYVVAGNKYVWHTLDYGAVGEWCLSRTGQLIVCEQVGADWLPFVPFRMLAGCGKRTQEAVYLR